MKYAINAIGAPDSIGPYSQGTTAGRLVFASGQLPISPDDCHALVEGGIAEQTERVIDIIETILAPPTARSPTSPRPPSISPTSTTLTP